MKHQKTIEQEVINFAKRHQLLLGAEKILIGLSGGADSVFALHFFNKYQKKYKIKVSAVHVNHNLRGSEAERDENFCKELCSKLNIEFYSVNVDVKTFAKKNKKSIEEAARILRYQKFEEICEQNNCNLIVTAHNNDDNTETVLLNIVNGSGLDGLSGIPVKRDNIIRPFLCISKSDIIAYLKKEKIKFVQDSSNQNINFDRNYMRKNIIPNLKKNLNPALDKVVLNSSEVLKNQKKLLDFFIQNTCKNIISINNLQIVIDVKKLSKYPPEIFGEIVKNVFVNILKIDYSFSQFVKIKSLLISNVGTKVKITAKIEGFRERNRILFIKEKQESEIEINVKVNQQVKVNSKIFSITTLSKIPGKFNKDKMTEIISADNIKGDFILRNWKEGDKIRLLGMKGTKKVSDVLTDSKVKSSERKQNLVLLNSKEIVWLVGLQISDKYKITKETKSVLKLCLS